MMRTGGTALVGALICFLAFFGNVALGAAGAGVLVGDVAEMLTLFVAALLFVVGVLLREAAEKGAPANNHSKTHGREHNEGSEDEG